jgi:hypothetical protein
MIRSPGKNLIRVVIASQFASKYPCEDSVTRSDSYVSAFSVLMTAIPPRLFSRRALSSPTLSRIVAYFGRIVVTKK